MYSKEKFSSSIKSGIINLHKTLKTLRKFRNLTPTDVASVINITVDFYKDLENGEGNITAPLA